MLCNEKYMGDSMLQKYNTKNFLNGKRLRNEGERNRYYVHNLHQGIISKEIFLEIMCEINSRKKRITDADSSLKVHNKRYNTQNVLGNIMLCEECGASFKRRTERGKVKYWVRNTNGEREGSEWKKFK